MNQERDVDQWRGSRLLRDDRERHRIIGDREVFIIVVRAGIVRPDLRPGRRRMLACFRDPLINRNQPVDARHRGGTRQRQGNPGCVREIFVRV